MSYILDALRKADADRERGHVPSIHAQTVLPGTAMVSAARGPRIGLWIALGVLILVLAVGLTWWLAGASSQRETPATAVANRPPSMPVAAAPPSAAVPEPAPAASAATPSPSTAASPALTAATKAKPKAKPAAPATAATARAQGETSPAAPRTSMRAAPATEAPPIPSGATSQSANTPNAAAGAGPHEGKIYAMTELPDNIRAQLPQIAIGGAMYSPVPANRLLIVNGQVLHEGDRITADVVLEQVRVKSAVLAFKGYRYLVNF